MTREEAIEILQGAIKKPNTKDGYLGQAIDMAIKALELEPCCNCIDFKRYAKQMGFRIESQSIPYIMYKEMDIPLSECQKAYDVAMEYLRSQAKVKG